MEIFWGKIVKEIYLHFRAPFYLTTGHIYNIRHGLQFTAWQYSSHNLSIVMFDLRYFISSYRIHTERDLRYNLDWHWDQSVLLRGGPVVTLTLKKLRTPLYMVPSSISMLHAPSLFRPLVSTTTHACDTLFSVVWLHPDARLTAPRAYSYFWGSRGRPAGRWNN